MSSPKTIVITGASGGIGLELARIAAEQGFALVLVARGHDSLQMIARELREAFNVEVEVIELDLSKAGAAKKLAVAIAKEGIEPYVLINNAGFGLGGAFARQDPVRISAMMQLNMVALTELTRILLPGMIERSEGRVLNVASTAAFLPGPYMAVYYATKSYVLSFSQALSDELKGSGVTATALCPPPTKTHFAKEADLEGTRLFSGKLMSAREVAQAGFKGMLSGKRVVLPGAAAKRILWLSRILPTRLALPLVRRIQGGK